MLTAYDCFDLHDIFTGIRNTPDNPENIVVIQQLITVFEMMREGKILSALGYNIRNVINSTNESAFHLGFHDRYYTGHYSCTDEAVIDSFNTILCKMLMLSQNRDYESLEKLADRIHEIPLKILENKRYEKHIIRISKRYKTKKE